MKRKILAVFTALTVFAMGSVTAFAASPTVGTTEAPVKTQKASTVLAATEAPGTYLSGTSVSTGYQVSAVSDTTVQAAAVAVQNSILNDVASIASKIGNKTLADSAKNAGSQVTAKIVTVIEVKASSAAKDANGNYVVTLNLSDIAKGDAVVVRHYTGSTWETMVPSSVEKGAVTISSASLSPIAVVKLSAAGVSLSPQTGSSIPVAAVILIVGVVGTAVCGKKYFA